MTSPNERMPLQENVEQKREAAIQAFQNELLESLVAEIPNDPENKHAQEARERATELADTIANHIREGKQLRLSIQRGTEFYSHSTINLPGEAEPMKTTHGGFEAEEQMDIYAVLGVTESGKIAPQNFGIARNRMVGGFNSDRYYLQSSPENIKEVFGLEIGTPITAAEWSSRTETQPSDNGHEKFRHAYTNVTGYQKRSIELPMMELEEALYASMENNPENTASDNQ